MPVYFSVPLPGPFRYSHRISPRRYRRAVRHVSRGPYWPNRFHRATYWLSCLWVAEAYWWLGWLAVKGGMWAWNHRGLVTSRRA